MSEKICSICGHAFTEFGNNPAPFPWDKDERCCDDCNTRFVVPLRLTPTAANEKTINFLTRIAQIGKGLAVANEKAKELISKRKDE